MPPGMTIRLVPASWMALFTPGQMWPLNVSRTSMLEIFRSAFGRFIHTILNHSLIISLFIKPFLFAQMITFFGKTSFGIVFRRNTIYGRSFCLLAVQQSMTVNRVCSCPSSTGFLCHCGAAWHIKVDRGLASIPELAEKVVFLVPQLDDIPLEFHLSLLVVGWESLCTHPLITLNVDRLIPSGRANSLALVWFSSQNP